MAPIFYHFVKNFELYGVDFSDEMIRLARKYANKFDFPVNLAVADICYLPYNNEAFDYVIAVATYHHLKRHSNYRLSKELKRVLKPGGTAFITVWNRWQPRFWFKGKEDQGALEDTDMKHCIVIIIFLLMGN